MDETAKPTRELIAKMRAAADTLEESLRLEYARHEVMPNPAETPQSPGGLRIRANRWERLLDADDEVLIAVESLVREHFDTPLTSALAVRLVERFDIKPKEPKS